MFNNEEREFNWRILVASIAGLIVLVGGIYIGINSIDEESETENVSHTNLEESIDAFYLNENCQIVINTVDEATEETISSKVISPPDELFNKTEEEIIEYMQQIYPNTKVESLSQGEILLIEESPYKNIERKNKYSIEIEDGIIGVYKYDINGNRTLEKQTSENIDSLPQKLQEEIQKGILADSIEEIEAMLDSILS